MMKHLKTENKATPIAVNILPYFVINWLKLTVLLIDWIEFDGYLLDFYHLPAYWKTMENGLLDSERKKETRPVIAGFDQNGKYIYVGRCEFQSNCQNSNNCKK